METVLWSGSEPGALAPLVTGSTFSKRLRDSVRRAGSYSSFCASATQLSKPLSAPSGRRHSTAEAGLSTPERHVVPVWLSGFPWDFKMTWPS